LSDMANVLVVVGALAEKIGLKYTFSKTKKKVENIKNTFAFFYVADSDKLASPLVEVIVHFLRILNGIALNEEPVIIFERNKQNEKTK